MSVGRTACVSRYCLVKAIPKQLQNWVRARLTRDSQPYHRAA